MQRRRIASSMVLLWALVSSACAGDEVLAPADDERVVTIAAGAVAAEISERFLSVAVDSAQVVGGTFWDPAGRSEIIGTHRVQPYDFDRPQLRRLARELAPAYLRIGGTDADRVYYDLGKQPQSSAPAGYEWVLTRALWDRVQRFASELDYRVLFTLNAGPGPRDGEGRWVADNAKQLIDYTVQRKYPVDIWELGNEINGYSLLLGLSLKPAVYADDVRAARALLDARHPSAKLAAPSVAYWPKAGDFNGYYERFMPLGGQWLDLVTWHYYPQQSRRCPVATRRAGPDVMLQPEHLDEVGRWADSVLAGAPGREVWLGETGNAQCGGEPEVSDRYVGGFWWLDQLGMMARRGMRAVVRQTLSGSNYGLLVDGTLEPNPDYWSSVLWRRLMGRRVLAATGDAGAATLRAYAHCARESAPGYQPGAVVVLLLNLDRERSVGVQLEGLPPGTLHEYLLTAEGLRAHELLLNGQPLALDSDGAVPALEPRILERSSAPLRVVLPATSYGFVVVPAAGSSACGG